MWVGLGGFQVIVNRGVVILQVNGIASGLIVLLVLRAPRHKHRDGNQQHKLPPSTHVLSGISTQGKPSLCYLMESSIGLVSPASRCIPYVVLFRRSHLPVP